MAQADKTKTKTKTPTADKPKAAKSRSKDPAVLARKVARMEKHHAQHPKDAASQAHLRKMES